MPIPHGPILVVEDIHHIREFLEVTLRFKGYPVVSARDGQQALEQARQQHPALVITDVLMPKLDGFSLAYQLRNDPATRDVPIVFLSATYIAPEDKDFALRLGAVHFLEKPIDTEELFLTVAEVLTQGPPSLPEPLDAETFYREYRARLEDKLRHKSSQIARMERLLEDLPLAEQPTFESLLGEARGHRDQIRGELDQLYQILEELDT
jgi:CheY-like chemotaxis protein